MRGTKLVARTVIVAMMATTLSNCAATPENCRVEQDTTGQGIMIGAGVGVAAGGIAALAAHQRNGNAAAIMVGAALVGGLVGAIVAHERDRACHELALRQALDQAVAQNAMLQREREEAERKAAEEEAQQRAKALRPEGQNPSEAAPAAVVTPVSHTPPEPAKKPEYMSVAWANRVTGHSGTITPLADVSDANAKEVCITFKDDQTVDGQTKTVIGKACRGSDGDWKPA